MDVLRCYFTRKATCEAAYDDWFPLLCDNSAFVIDKVIKSNRHRNRKFDPETGEII